ncbi:glycogen debranching protein [Flavihumibacter sp. R14]|nr:glycogen debranching protein [Flavihumibacter soli]
MRTILKKLCVAALVLASSCKAQKTNTSLYSSESYSVTTDQVLQGDFSAKALSSTEVISNYQSPVNLIQSPKVQFKFSINGKDNEMISGKDHHINVLSQDMNFTSPLLKFGHQYVDTSVVPAQTYLKPDTKFTLRLDMREVLEAFKSQGYYTTFNGNKIFKDDFKGVYVAGSLSPLIWDFDNLVNHPALQLKDPDGDGIYEISLILNEQKEQKLTAASWKLSKDISAFPQYTSAYPLADALYNLALEEMENAVEPDSTFRTGKEWAGVWTRDISYSIILAMATLQPKVAEYSLLRKVKNNRIIQDTGTGGSYPVSSDRMIWAVAAWEVYKTTGDKSWLDKAYRIIKNSVEDDLKNIYDPVTGLVKGESSFLDWREQTYPKWMQPADIYESECLGANAVHYQTNIVLAEMATLLNDPEAVKKYAAIAKTIKNGINTYLWIPEKGYYGQYLYGRTHKILSQRSEALGEALCVLFGIADAEKSISIISNTPVSDFGITCIYPQIPNMPPYHNNAVWPFVQAYWSLAAAKAGNEPGLTQSISAIYRPAALFLTNKENFVASNGDFAGTQINSSNMLWSLAGNLSTVYNVLFGIEFQANSLLFKPFVPKALQGKRTLNKFKYRNALLDIEMEGYGNKIKSITMDGNSLANAEIPANLSGKHAIRILLENNEPEKGRVNLVNDYTSPAEPVLNYSSSTISWEKVPGAVNYKVLRNGKEVSRTSGTKITPAANSFGEYQVIALDKENVESFASEPIQVYPEAAVHITELENVVPASNLPYRGFSGKGFIEISKQANTTLNFDVTVPEAGHYSIDFKYANGHGPTNTENKCAIRSLSDGSTALGTIVFPQRGKEEWSNWGFSNAVQVSMKKGKQTLSLTFNPENENMNGEINQAMLDYVRLIKID